MGWFTKKEKIPEIPSVSKLPELPQTSEKQDLPELPSFQNNSIGEQFNNALIKSAVQDSSGEREVEVEEVGIPTPEEAAVEENVDKGERRTLELSPSMNPSMSSTKSLEPIFVRIDKFHEAKKDFEEIKKKMKDIENVLKKVKDIKTREDSEVSGWSDELEKVKSRLSEIDDNFFNKL
jgi:hypothetical protein